MKKASKALLAKALISKIPSRHTKVVATDYVLNRGNLLHRVRWPPNLTYNDIICQYQMHIKMKFGRCHIVFDGYANGTSNKDHEHRRRIVIASADIQVSGDLPAFCNQDAFVSNSKMPFIQLLGEALEGVGHHVEYSHDDADTLIASTALEIASSGRNVSVVADDTDALILLCMIQRQNKTKTTLFHFIPSQTCQFHLATP